MKKIILKATPKKQPRDKAGRWFYILVFVSIVTVGTTGYFIRTRDDAITKLSENSEIDMPDLSPAVTREQIHIDIPDKAEESQPTMVPEHLWQSDGVIPVSEDDQPEVTEVFEESVPEPTVPKVTSLIIPVNGDILKKHSDTELAYSKTMEDWRLHKGIDIHAPIGSTVIASAGGTVHECYTDDAYGITVIVDHGNGLMTKYSNLSSTDMVEEGHDIDSGSAIGVVGDTAEFEIAEEAHLHFEVIKDGRSVNPEEYFN